MTIRSNLNIALILIAFSLSAIAHAQTTPAIDEEAIEVVPEAEVSKPEEITIDEKELPGESVTPKTDIPTAVINKNLNLKNRLALDLATGNILDEPLVNANYFLVRVSYFTGEEISYGLGFKSRFGGKTSYSQQLYDGSAQLEFERAPSPTDSYFFSIGYSFYYGKLSLTKDTTMTATTKLDTDLGMQKTGTAQKPFVQAAITQSFFFNSHLALGLSYGLSLAQLYDPTSVNIRSSQPIPAESDFATKLRFNQYLSLNLTTIF